MPFDNMDDLDSREAYISILKEELNALRGSGEAADFYFLEKFRFDGKNADPVLIVGKVTSRFLSRLRQLPGDVAQGHCSVRGGELRIIPKRGRTPESKLKNALRGTQYKPELIADVTGVAEEEEQSHRLETERQLEEAEAQFKKVKKHISSKDARALKTMFGKYETIFKTKDYAGAQKQLSTLNDSMAEMLKYSMRESRAIIKKRERDQAKIKKTLEEVAAVVKALEAKIADVASRVPRLRDGLKTVEPTRKNASGILELRDRVNGHEKTLKQAAGQIDKAKRKLATDFDKLKKMKDPVGLALATHVVAMGGKIKAVEKSIDAVPLKAAKANATKAIKALKNAVE